MSGSAKRRKTIPNAADWESEDELASPVTSVAADDRENDVLTGDDIHTTPRASAAAHRPTSTRKGKQDVSDAPPLSPPISSSVFTQQLRLGQTRTRRTRTSSQHGSQSSRRGPTSSAASRSSSSIKGPDDLFRLERPVRWLHSTVVELRTALQATGGAAVDLFRQIHMITGSRRGFLPLELQPILGGELDLDEGDAHFFAARPARPTSEQERNEAIALLGIDMFPGNRSIDEVLLLLDLRAELTELRSIVSSTGAFKASPHPEAAWNARIHDRILELAVRQGQPATAHTAVGIENITRAKIAKPFVPTTADTDLDLDLLLPPGGSNPESKMVDYAMVLRLLDNNNNNNDDNNDNNSGSSKANGLAQRIAVFVSRLADVATFNNTTFAPLCLNPAGIFIETKVDTKRYAEAQAQLGIWVASWFARVAMFLPSGAPPPVPLILAIDESWELWFAVYSMAGTCIYGPVKIGGTGSLTEAYTLLGVLRLLVGWVQGPFRDWVIRCIGA